MKVVPKTPAHEKKPKRIPMHKDPVYMAKLRVEFIAASNARVRKREAKG